MSVRVTAVVYGTVNGQAPYQGTNSGNAFADFKQWDSPAVMSFPAGSGVVFHPVTPGQRVGNSATAYIYSIIEVPSTSSTPNPQSARYASGKTVATLATDAS